LTGARLSTLAMTDPTLPDNGVIHTVENAKIDSEGGSQRGSTICDLNYTFAIKISAIHLFRWND
jgi:hypothetical protein